MRISPFILPFFQLLVVLLSGCVTPPKVVVAPKWSRFEITLKSSVAYTNPIQQAELTATFTAPDCTVKKVYGFWDGAKTWRVRFSPDQLGSWKYVTQCSDPSNPGLGAVSGSFTCTTPVGTNRFSLHGPIVVSADGHYLTHQDGTPFFWLGDTAWNGPLLSTDDDWYYYLFERQRQQFSAVQWVTTQWRAALDGDREKHLAYTGTTNIEINPKFFQRLDKKVEQMNRVGLLSVPVLLWDNGGRTHPGASPGVGLPDDQAIRLARYMVARWQGDDVVWILNGDGDYRGPKSERWKKIGRDVFGEISHSPVTLHPSGRQWVLNEFANEKWLDICGYQSGHTESVDNLRWIFGGPPATDWNKPPPRPFISLEAPYENHNSGATKKPMSDFIVRRAHYWSLLNAPTAGVTYGGHGIWGWDDGTQAPVDHPDSGIPLPWKQALHMPGAEQMSVLAGIFQSLDFWKLRPAPGMLSSQPGAPAAHISAARTTTGDQALIYSPSERRISVLLKEIPVDAVPEWINPRTGARSPGIGVVTEQTCEFPTPAEGDWVLTLRSGGK